MEVDGEPHGALRCLGHGVGCARRQEHVVTCLERCRFAVDDEAGRALNEQHPLILLLDMLSLLDVA